MSDTTGADERPRDGRGGATATRSPYRPDYRAAGPDHRGRTPPSDAGNLPVVVAGELDR